MIKRLYCNTSIDLIPPKNFFKTLSGWLPFGPMIYGTEKLQYAPKWSRPKIRGDDTTEGIAWNDFQLCIEKLIQLCIDTCQCKFPI